MNSFPNRNVERNETKKAKGLHPFKMEKNVKKCESFTFFCR